MTNAQRTWNVGETVEGEDYKHMPAGVFVPMAHVHSRWLASLGGSLVSYDGERFTAGELQAPRVIIARPLNAPAHIPVYVANDVREQIRMLDKIKAEAQALIAERDALKQALRKARDACQRLREERDAARRGQPLTGGDKQRHIASEMRKPVFTPALGAFPKTREDFAACPVGTQIQFRDEKVRWEKRPNGVWAYDISSTLTNTDGEMASYFNDWEKRITLLPLARKAESEGAVIRKGDKVSLPAQYDALPPGSRVRRTADKYGDYWEKTSNGGWWCMGEKVRDLSFPRTVLRIGYDDNVHTCLPAKPTDKPALRVGDVLCTVEEISRAPIGTAMHKNGPAFTWRRTAAGWVLDGTQGPALRDDNMSLPGIWTVTHVPPAAPRFHVGQVISTREEYEALPIASRVSFSDNYPPTGAYLEKVSDSVWRSENPQQHGTSFTGTINMLSRKILRIGPA